MTLKRIESPNLANTNHGFYTRLGGASSGIFSGLNCGIGSSDQREIVEINRARVAEDMGCLLYTSPSPRDLSTSRMPSSA